MCPLGIYVTLVSSEQHIPEFYSVAVVKTVFHFKSSCFSFLNFLQLDGTDLFNFVDGYQTWADYLTNMERDGTWGDHVILYAAANCYQTCICVISSLPHHDDQTVKPDCPIDSTNRPLVLGHVHELHYVSLQPIQGNA